METLEITGKKLNMTQVFKEDGTVVPVTLVEVAAKPETEEEIEIKGKSVVVTGTSKGKGFTGVIKRWNFQRQPETRGASDKVRVGGAIGAQTPGRVFKGKRMAGRSGGKRVTIRGLEIVDFKEDDNLILVSGSIPGPRNSEVTLKVEL
ncbi:50S ribosomal protein L3 [candidate division WWE3 bacterium]|nr:50S ribosomal protein L3 [candidate division WWE3 bacterium]